MSVRRLVLALGVLSVGSVGAMAADMPLKAPLIVPPPPFSWNGCYVGGNAGGIYGRDRFDTYPAGSISDFNPGPNNHSYTGNTFGFIGGVQAGCNWSWTPNWVFGFEADISGTSLKESISADYPAIVQTTPPTTWTAHNETVTKDIPWLATFRGRFGYAFGKTWLYATGGAAVAQVKASLSYVSSTAAFSNIGSTDVTRVGWTAGAGIEQAIDNHWSVKAEYLYVDLGNFSFISPNVVPGGGDTRAWGTTVKAREHIFRIGLNFRF
jgi:outer membrane immunogenic protein